jgi:hypothetical protein
VTGGEGGKLDPEAQTRPGLNRFEFLIKLSFIARRDGGKNANARIIF